MSSSSDEDFEGDMEDLLATVGKKFLIVSKMNGKVVDISKCKSAEGTKVIMYDRKTEKNINQLWYLDSEDHIKSALNNMTFYAEKEGQSLKTSRTNDPRGKWRIDGEKILNSLGQCLDIKGKSNFNKAELCAYKFKGDANQKWKIEYV